MWRRIGRFNVVGLGGFLLQLGTLALLTRVFGWHYAVAAAVAIEAAILHNFVGHSRWTWADRRPAGGRAWALRLVRYQAVKSVVLAVNLGVTVAMVTGTGLPVEAASLCAIAGCSVFSFLASDRLIFMEAAKQEKGGIEPPFRLPVDMRASCARERVEESEGHSPSDGFS